MPDWTLLYNWIPILLPFEIFEMRFMQKALLGLLLLSPMVALMGIQVVHFRMAFFADAISHSAFTGVALGVIFVISPHWTMPIFAIIVGIAITFYQRHSTLSTDTVIGVFFSGVVAFGLMVVSREKSVVRDIQRFLYGDILTMGDKDLLAMAALLMAIVLFQTISFNRMLQIGLNPLVAKVHGIRVAGYQYIYTALLSLVVIFSVWAVGVMLVTAMLIIPSATARNLSNSAGAMVWWALLVSTLSSIIGLLISAQEWARTATGATVIMVAALFFLLSTIPGFFKEKKSTS